MTVHPLLSIIFAVHISVRKHVSISFTYRLEIARLGCQQVELDVERLVNGYSTYILLRNMNCYGLSVLVLFSTWSIVSCNNGDAQSYQVVQVPDSSHNLIICQEQPGDRLLLREVVKKKFSVGAFVDATVQFPLDGVPGNATVHCVKALDQRTDGTGGYARIIDGGLGQRLVTVYIRSQLWRGFEFIVEIGGQ